MLYIKTARLMQKIIQIYPCLLKLSRKQESVTDGRYYYIPSPLSRGDNSDAKKQHFCGNMSMKLLEVQQHRWCNSWVLASSAVDRGFEPPSGQTKDYKIGIC
jgi:hypothetical protein